MIYFIYFTIGLVTFIYGVEQDRKEYSSTVKDILTYFIGLFFFWPLLAVYMLIEWLEEDSKLFQKILRKVVIKRKGL